MTFAPLLLALASPLVPQTPPPQPAGLTALHRSGQTFLTWQEASHEQVHRYRVYRHDAPIDETNLAGAELLLEVAQDSSRFYADRYFRPAVMQWATRYHERFVISDGGAELPAGTGLFVWTLAPEDFGGAAAGDAWYAITSVAPDGSENTSDFGAGNAIGPVAEEVDDPVPVRSTPLVGGIAHVYTQFLDVRHFNATAAAPNAYNDWYGFDPAAPAVARALQYAFTYVVFAPIAGCNFSGAEGGRHPVVVNPHPFGGEKARPMDYDPTPTWCNAYRIYPIDPFNTWWFGNARNHDYRQGLVVPPGDVIENFTEARVLRMVLDLARDPVHGPKVDLERVYVYGHSMGGSGALSLAVRYPNVFAAAHASQPMTDYEQAGAGGGDDWRPDVTVKLGAPALELPVESHAPSGLADHLVVHDGTVAWQWQDHQTQLVARRGEEIAPLGIDHSVLDFVIEWPTQGEPAYAPFDASARCWRGLVQNTPHVGSGIAAMPGPFGKDPDGLPFAGFRAVRDETVPGLSGSSQDALLPPTGVGEYNAGIDWSASWSDWDGAPIDEPARWRMSLRTTGASSLTVDVTPRRLQSFGVAAGVPYAWRQEALDGVEIDSGLAAGDADALVTVPDVTLDAAGSRLTIVPSFTGSTATVSISGGGSQVLSLTTASHFGGAIYFVLGSISGTAPALPLGPGLELPLVFDGYTQFTLAQPNSPILQPSLSLLDTRGEATCVFTLPPGLPSQLAGATLQHAFIVIDPAGLAFVSNAVPVVLAP